MQTLRQFLARRSWLPIAAASALGFLVSARAADPSRQNGNQGTNSPTPSNAAASFSPGVRDVLKLLNSKVNSEVIEAFIGNSRAAYELSADQLLQLKDRGVPSALLTAMLNRGGELRAQRAQLAQAMAQSQMSPPPQNMVAPPAAPAPVQVTPTYYAPAYTSYSYGYPLFSSPWYSYWPDIGYASFSYWNWPYAGCYAYGGYPWRGRYSHYWRPYRGYYPYRSWNRLSPYAPVYAHQRPFYGHAGWARAVPSAGFNRGFGRPAFSPAMGGGFRGHPVAAAGGGFRGGGFRGGRR